MSSSSTPDHGITRHLAGLAAGDREAAAELLPRVYDELHRLAVAHFRRQPADHTLQPTALVHEAYLKLFAAPGSHARDRRHFFILASTVMRQILVDHARARKAAKRGSGRRRVTLSETIGGSTPDIDMLALDEALKKLATLKPERARLVELRFFGGLTSEEAGEVLGMSRAEVARKWRTIKAWLADELRAGEAA